MSMTLLTNVMTTTSPDDNRLIAYSATIVAMDSIRHGTSPVATVLVTAAAATSVAAAAAAWQ